MESKFEERGGRGFNIIPILDHIYIERIVHILWGERVGGKIINHYCMIIVIVINVYTV